MFGVKLRRELVAGFKVSEFQGFVELPNPDFPIPNLETLKPVGLSL